MKIVDFHTHFFPDRLFKAIWRWFEKNEWPIRIKKFADDLVAILKKEGVLRCVSLHYPHKAEMAEALNRFALDLAQKYPDFIIPFGSVHPDDSDKEKILRSCFEKYRFKGIKVHCHVQKVAPDDPRMESVYEVCEEYRRIVLIHCGTGPHFKKSPGGGYGYDVTRVAGCKRFEKVLKKYPRITFVVPHLGFEEYQAFVDLLSDYPNLYLDTAMTLVGYYPMKVKGEWLADHSDRILFGTDFPQIPHEWAKEKQALLSFGLGTSIESKIFFENASRLLGIVTQATGLS